MPTTLIYPLAALAEIAGCFAIWAWWRGASILWLLPGIVSLALFGWLLALVEAGFAGRAYAAYGGVSGLSSPTLHLAEAGGLVIALAQLFFGAAQPKILSRFGGQTVPSDVVQ